MAKLDAAAVIWARHLLGSEFDILDEPDGSWEFGRLLERGLWHLRAGGIRAA